MINLNEKFTTFILSALKILLGILMVVSLITVIGKLIGINLSIIPVIIIYGLNILGGYFIIKSKLSSKKKIFIILLQAFIIRVLWIINVNSQPGSDFNTMYQAALQLINGDNSMFTGTAYLGRFPHLTGMVLYMALMRSIFPVSSILAMKIVNLFLGVSVVYLLYLTVNELFENINYSLYAALGATLLPSLVSYTTVLCSENIAMPFYIFSVYLFIKFIKGNRKIYLLLFSSILLAVGNFFRTVATVVLIAYILYSIVYYKGMLKNKINMIVALIIPYIMFMIIVSTTLQTMDITEYPLWRGSEPSITNVLKGTNILSGGRWNSEDASLPEECNFDYNLIEERSKEIIIERLTGTSPIILLIFYITKFSLQWNEGDFAGVFWAQYNLEDSDIIIDFSKGGTGIMQVFYTAILILIFLGLFNKNKIKENQAINLIYIILCGYGLAYLITESQGRYSYICSWIFVILAVVGLDFIKSRMAERRYKTHEEK
ncbi:MAG: dolichyl-phosphate-mannose--protein mannosyltransferase [Clostridiales bacterium]|nr:dolichyl-phosphate-mannose--protein mannosyltransferase [Clostridiales bacterium]